jgi:CheY-like chemotaxis protein
MGNHSYKHSWSELDSFYESRIVICLVDLSMVLDACQILSQQGFSSVRLCDNADSFYDEVCSKKHDLIIIDLGLQTHGLKGYEIVRKIRENDADVALITVSDCDDDMKRKLDFSIHRHFRYPFLSVNLVKAIKKALGDKISYEIGMQFFDALFGMQMCTHRDLHQRTFDHVIRTTKIYAKFLLYLSRKEYIELTSWVFKNCLMAALLHDIGKLLVMHGVLYKDGKLSAFEYEQVRRHPWNSITALLGGHDIDSFARGKGPIHSVSGYNDKNLAVQVQRWVFKMMNGDDSSFSDIENYFENLATQPFIHSLNMDLLYIVLRHHDGLDQSYFTDDELLDFGRIIGRPIASGLSDDSPLDVVTNVLSICDMYDALLDTKRDYRKNSYCKYFALFLLYGEMKRRKFFPFVVHEFIRYVVENEMTDHHSPLYTEKDSDLALQAIETMSGLFIITRDQEGDFNEFLMSHSAEFMKYAPYGRNEGLIALHAKWIAFHDSRRKEMMAFFISELAYAGLMDRDIKECNDDEIKTFDMLFQFYYSYASSFKQKKLIDYLVYSVTRPVLSHEARKRIADAVLSNRTHSRRDLERYLHEEGYDRDDLLRVFKNYDEDTLINELNDYLRRAGV